MMNLPSCIGLSRSEAEERSEAGEHSREGVGRVQSTPFRGVLHPRKGVFNF